MKTILRLEEAAMFALSIYAFSTTDFAWWWYLVLILVPDIGMLGYLVNTKVGALTYNLFHLKFLGIALYVTGIYFDNSWTELAGIIIFGHASMDRMIGYGLKHEDSFHHTHLGWMKGSGTN
jgi:hypothetical protein